MKINEIEQVDSFSLKLRDLELEDLKKESYFNTIKQAKLFYTCYEILSMNLSLFKKDKEKIKEFLDSFTDYGYFKDAMKRHISNEYGQFFIIPRIEKYMNENSKDIKTLIELFFWVFQ